MWVQIQNDTTANLKHKNIFNMSNSNLKPQQSKENPLYMAIDSIIDSIEEVRVIDLSFKRYGNKGTSPKRYNRKSQIKKYF